MTRPRLSPKVRLKLDRRRRRCLLLYPERGLELNGTAKEIAQLCTGEWTVDQMITHLARLYPGVPSCDLQRDIQAFLDALIARGLLGADHG